MTQIPQWYPLEGGLDLVSPAITAKPGSARAVENYESVDAGYQRVGGFERFSGDAKPSAQSYWVMNFDAGVLEPTVGSTITGASSGATGIIVSIVEDTGTWGSNQTGSFVLRVVSGTFTNDENLTVSFPIAFSSGFSSGFN